MALATGLTLAVAALLIFSCATLADYPQSCNRYVLVTLLHFREEKLPQKRVEFINLSVYLVRLWQFHYYFEGMTDTEVCLRSSQVTIGQLNLRSPRVE